MSFTHRTETERAELIEQLRELIYEAQEEIAVRLRERPEHTPEVRRLHEIDVNARGLLFWLEVQQ